jgi:hypothetical protein
MVSPYQSFQEKGPINASGQGSFSPPPRQSIGPVSSTPQWGSDITAGFKSAGLNIEDYKNPVQAIQNMSIWGVPAAKDEQDWLANFSGPQQRSLIEALVRSMNDPANLEADARGFGNASWEQAGKGADALGVQLRGAGFGSGAVGGATAGLYGNAQKNINNYRTQMMSPQQKLQRLMASLQALQGASTPATDMLYRAADKQNQQPQSNDPSMFQTLMGFAPLFL